MKILFFIFISIFTVANAEIKKYDCVVIPSSVADLGSNVRGVISEILVDRNDFVKKNDVIAQLDNKVEKASMEVAKKQASLTSEIKFRKVSLTYAQREERRAKKAFESKALSLHDYDKAKVETQLAEIELLQAEEKRLLAQKKLEQARARFIHKTILAPFSGVVMERFKTIGEYIDDDPVVRLAQLDPLYVELIVPVENKNSIKVGMEATICSDRNNNKGWRVQVSQVDEVIDAASGTFGVRLLLPNPEYKIPAGLRCDLVFMKNNKKEGVTSSHD